ncbi:MULTISPECIES: SIMPL domain-containing protein [unclassified Modestobacter]|uniref:SIMPL domain-containing protein n=1 Tax=unclassified Modestobacter TaxID=2643866 RepID=UPI0022AA36D4|nr:MULTISPECIES: SIMPL domain-containing protein [unclassified Modestobacter]MCZ2826168.1 SIMPL domain-containing protein [Modestobacter sp. VKM Ac-2981]MCZ2852767.1 SIMPL domain-containing protein [Modestobacter sp. VKM Ac-2982]
MSRRRIRHLLFALVAVLGTIATLTLLDRPQAVRAAPAGPPPDAAVQVEGVGTATGTPDVLRVTVGVEATAETVQEALDQADAAVLRVFEALRAEEVPERDVQTVGLSIDQAYAEDGREPTGYTARQDLGVTLRDVQEAGETIGALVDAGGDAARLRGVSYALEDDAGLEAEARAEALAAARQKAEHYAELTGRELGEVVEIREQVSSPGPMPFAGADAAMAEAVPLAPGSSTVTVTAQVRWSLR